MSEKREFPSFNMLFEPGSEVKHTDFGTAMAAQKSSETASVKAHEALSISASLVKLANHVPGVGALRTLLNQPAIKARFSSQSTQTRVEHAAVTHTSSPAFSTVFPTVHLAHAAAASPQRSPAAAASPVTKLYEGTSTTSAAVQPQATPAAAPVSPTFGDEANYISGVTSTGAFAPISWATWSGDGAPDQNGVASAATYRTTTTNASKWAPGGASAAPTVAGSAGGLQYYYFDPSSNFTPLQQNALASGLSLWSAVANIQFQLATTPDQISAATLDFKSNDGTGPDGGTYESSGGNFVPETLTTDAHPLLNNQGAGTYLTVDDSATGFQLGNFNLNGGPGVGAILHEEGHYLGLGHGGPYNGSNDPSVQQYSAFDSHQYDLMSYIGANVPNAEFTAQNPNPGATNYGDSTTLMPLDILAVQQLYGSSVNSPTPGPLSGGQVFGYNDNVDMADYKTSTGAPGTFADPGTGIHQYFDFSNITTPVVTLFDTGTGNTLDLSVDHSAETINLNPFSYSSFAGDTDNLAIAYNTAIDTFDGGTAGTNVTVNSDADTIKDQGTGNTVDFSGTLASYLIVPTGPNTIAVTNIATSVTDTLTDVQSLAFSDQTIPVPCFLVGTRVTTSQGEVAVEHLKVGDLVVTQSGDLRPIRWLGSRQLECARYQDPSSIWPVRILAGAFAENLPVRDLWLSPGHSVLIEGVLVQAGNLVNGATVVRVPRERVEYWHVELDSHDILISEGLATESYLDTGNRTGFVGGGDFLEAHPDFSPKHWAQTCVPLILEGPELVRAKERLLARAAELGYVITDDAEIHIVADGKWIDPERISPTRLAFMLPSGCSIIELCSRTFIPAHVVAESGDSRALGLCVARIQLDGSELPLERESAFEEGWHQLETYADHKQRWSRGRSTLPAGTRLVVLDIASRSYCWVKPESSVVALFG